MAYPPYPYLLHVKLAKSDSPQRDDVMEALNYAMIMREAARDMEATIRELQADKRRLMQENEFMLRLLNEMNQECGGG